jgi:hypothetical protein
LPAHAFSPAVSPDVGSNAGSARATRRATQAAALDPGRSAAEARDLSSIAQAGLAGPAGAFPHRERIAAAFGRFAPPRLNAAVGRAASRAGDALHADAFVLNGRAGFARPPGLHVAAHEAAHLVEQGYGRAPAGGVGAPGDRGERLAEAAARAVTAGRSAEPVFAAAFGDAPPRGPAATPALQMYNRIDSYTAPKVDNPWTELETQLQFDKKKFNLKSAMTKANAAFGTMWTTLGARSRRAEEVKAVIDGKRKGGARGGDKTQTAYGTLGTFMEFITGTPQASSPPSYFEGGHLVSDEILGDDSYVEQNFAPQRRQINSPAYRKIEKMAASSLDAVSSTVTSDEPCHEMEVNLTYLGSTVDVKTTDVEARLGIPPAAIQASPVPAHVSLTQRVPCTWKAKIDSTDADWVFDYESTVDPSNTSGASLGYLPSEHDVDMELPKVTTHIDATSWSMDSLKYAVKGSTTALGTGTKGNRASSHTFSAVQSVPMGQTQTQVIGLATTKPPVVTPTFSLTVPPDADLFEPSALKPTPKSKKRRNSLAKKIKQDNGWTDMTITALETGIGRYEYGLKLRDEGETVTAETELAKLKPTKAKGSQQTYEAAEVLFRQTKDGKKRRKLN